MMTRASLIKAVNGFEDMSTGYVLEARIARSVDQIAGAVTEFRAGWVGVIGDDPRDGYVAVDCFGCSYGALAAGGAAVRYTF